jgi:hypothetical protein
VSHSWLNRLVPILLFVPGIVTTGSIALPTTAQAVTTCDPLEVVASVVPGVGETVVFKLKNCTALAQNVVLSGKRRAPAKCQRWNLNFGDSPVIHLAPHQALHFFHNAADPTCKGRYVLTGDSEINRTEVVLDADLSSYTV